MSESPASIVLYDSCRFRQHIYIGVSSDTVSCKRIVKRHVRTELSSLSGTSANILRL